MQTRLGLRENARQFALLVLINAFVGAMVGLERALLPLMADEKFGLTTATAALSFIAVFGAAKAFANWLTGRLAGRFGRKKLLVAGWALGLPVPFLLGFGPSWDWILAANALLGLHQGLAWSSTVVMKIDLVGERERGLAMGLNEFAGYVAVALAAFGSGFLAEKIGASAAIFWAGLGLSVAGFALSLFWAKDTSGHAAQEAKTSCRPRLEKVFLDASWRHPSLSAIAQAGLANNLNDALVWGLLPILMLEKGFSLAQIGLAAGIYPLIWGIFQVASGRASDVFSKKELIALSMAVQAAGIFGFVAASEFWHFAALSAVLGLGTAAVYPTFLAAISDQVRPEQRAEAVGVFRFWRDAGYLVGALATGFLVDRFGTAAAIAAVGALTAFSAIIVLKRMRDVAPCEGPKPRSILDFLSKKRSQPTAAERLFLSKNKAFSIHFNSIA